MTEALSTPADDRTGARRIRAKQGANLVGANAHNRRILIDALRVNGALSRADLARATGLSGQAVANIVGELTRDGLVASDAPVRKPGRGQPATPFRLVAEGAYALGVQIDRHATRVVAADLLGADLVRLEAALPAGGPGIGLPVVARLVGRARAALAALAPVSAERLVGLGLAMPGPFGTPGGGDDPWMMSAWQAYPVVERLAEASGLEVALGNDAAAAAIAEKLSGAARGLDDFVYLHLGYGLGAGLMVRGEIHAGAARNAGEIGMVLSGPPAQGETGTALEHVVSIATLCRRLGLDPGDPRLFERLEAAVADETAGPWIAEAAPRLRWAVHTLETLIDPATIILGGSAPAALLDALTRAMLPLIPSHADRPGRSRPRLLTGRGDPWMVAIGAAAEPIARAFDPRFSAVQTAARSRA